MRGVPFKQPASSEVRHITGEELARQQDARQAATLEEQIIKLSLLGYTPKQISKKLSTSKENYNEQPRKVGILFIERVLNKRGPGC